MHPKGAGLLQVGNRQVRVTTGKRKAGDSPKNIALTGENVNQRVSVHPFLPFPLHSFLPVNPTPDDPELLRLIELFQSMGAPGDQAKRMAQQLQKRCSQLVEERGITRIEAMQHLLNIMVKGRRGEVPDGFGKR
ncbi:hypothetical protein OpiT1DRAFT_02169 [Opitutaceae bacterium TAV1]|nr:hypothetical protein OpiT1DRAFT_02169 [Opitutaceae bacterium TAV1]